MAVEGNGIRIKIGNVLTSIPHFMESPFQKLVHKAVVGVLRISSYSRKATHVIDLAENPHPHGIDHALGDEVVAIEPAQHLGLLEVGELGPKDFLLLPAHLLQHVLGHLEHVLQKLVVLLHLLHHHLLQGELVLLHGLPPDKIPRLFPSDPFTMGPSVSRPTPADAIQVTTAAHHSLRHQTFRRRLNPLQRQPLQTGHLLQ